MLIHKCETAISCLPCFSLPEVPSRTAGRCCCRSCRLWWPRPGYSGRLLGRRGLAAGVEGDAAARAGQRHGEGGRSALGRSCDQLSKFRFQFFIAEIFCNYFLVCFIKFIFLFNKIVLVQTPDELFEFMRHYFCNLHVGAGRAQCGRVEC